MQFGNDSKLKQKYFKMISGLKHFTAYSVENQRLCLSHICRYHLLFGERRKIYFSNYLRLRVHFVVILVDFFSLLKQRDADVQYQSL